MSVKIQIECLYFEKEKENVCLKGSFKDLPSFLLILKFMIILILIHLKLTSFNYISIKQINL